MTDWLVSWSDGPVKERILTRIDDFAQDPENLLALQSALITQQGTALTDILQSFNLISDSDADHLTVDWFGSHWWVSDPSPILREGFVQAIETALHPPSGGADFLPLDCYWVARDDANAGFSVAHSWTDRQVTVMIFTPPAGVPTAPPGSTVHLQPIKVTKLAGAEVVTAQLEYRE
jgi:hypothetical protein